MVAATAATALTVALLSPVRSPPAPRTRSPVAALSAWDEWSLQSVGVFDGAILAAGLTGIYFLASRDGEEEVDEAARAVEIAEEELRKSIEYSPCNGPSIEAIEALEMADEAAKKANEARGDPNELEPFAALRRRASPPKMQSGLPQASAPPMSGPSSRDVVVMATVATPVSARSTWWR